LIDFKVFVGTNSDEVKGTEFVLKYIVCLK